VVQVPAQMGKMGFEQVHHRIEAFSAVFLTGSNTNILLHDII
jgi:hypothetical protein